MDEQITTDLLIIGGGINGCGVAADATGRGLSIVLCERDDLASATSSASSKLIHGGLRYLEQYDFKLVREGLHEREVLMKKAPHLIHPLNFVLPHDKHLRPAWMIRIGLFLYDHLSKRNTLPSSKRLNLRNCIEGSTLKDEFTKGFRYADCQTDDARLTVANAMFARDRGAHILTHTTCVNAKRINGHWQATLDHNGKKTTVTAKAIVNAAGPWVTDVLHDVLHSTSNSSIKRVQGSHIVLPKLYMGNHAYILQNLDQRIVFAIPYQKDYTLIGTTDLDIKKDPRDSEVTQQEINYLCDVVSRYFKIPINQKDIVWAYWGARALYDDQPRDNQLSNPSKVTREYHLDVEAENNNCPIVSIFGGKITTYRTLAQHVMQKLKTFMPELGDNWTDLAPLPGGDIGGLSWAAYVEMMKKKYTWLPDELIDRYLHTYGSLTNTLLENCHQLKDLGEHFGCELYQREVDYLVEYEWALHSDDILWRRTKLGLQFNQISSEALDRYLLKP